jgi:hypothetical protein
LIVSSRETRPVPFNHIGEQDRTCKRRQEDLKVKGYGFVLQAQNRRSLWYIDSGCSNHMTRDKNIFVTLKKEEEGYVTFGNDNSSKIIGKGIINLGNKDVVAENVLLVENMKHNLLSVSQMCDKGHRLIFNSKECEIRKE